MTTHKLQDKTSIPSLLFVDISMIIFRYNYAAAAQYAQQYGQQYPPPPPPTQPQPPPPSTPYGKPAPPTAKPGAPSWASVVKSGIYQNYFVL